MIRPTRPNTIGVHEAATKGPTKIAAIAMSPIIILTPRSIFPTFAAISLSIKRSIIAYVDLLEV